MCGIAGSLGANGVTVDSTSGQLSLLRHRGPDSEGAFERGCGAVAQTRLAVIDLVNGDPPITNESGTIGAALNGEVYNFRSLREQLRVGGHRFRSDGDTEVIAHLAEDHSPVDLARRLDGMFAFATWDERRQGLVLGRDRLGKKPLYYWAGDGAFVFASEIKAVLAHPAVPRTLNPGALGAYLTFGYVPTPQTFFEGVLSVPPGHVLSVSPGGSPVVERYWQPAVPGVNGTVPVDLPLANAAEEVRSLLRAAVERRMVADVPLGAFLSGGIDSSAVVALMAELSRRPVSTFTIGFEDVDGFDERPFARTVAERFGTDHTEFVVKPDAAELIERLVWHHDQPFGDSSALPTYLLSQLTRNHVTVALCGDGGDEVFAGYERFGAALVRERLTSLPRTWRSGVQRLSTRVPASALGGRGRSLRRLLADPRGDTADAYRSWLSFVPREWRDRLLGGVGEEAPSDWAIDDYRRVFAGSAGASLLDRLLDLNLRTYLLDDLLPKVDRMSMAHGLEVRSPFLDTELVEFALRLPPRQKLSGLSLKRVLKLAMKDLLPPEIVGRTKHGFGVPLDRWFRTQLSDYVRSMLCSPASRLRGHLSGDAVEAMVGEHQTGVAAHGHALWTLLTLEVFLRREGW